MCLLLQCCFRNVQSPDEPCTLPFDDQEKQCPLAFGLYIEASNYCDLIKFDQDVYWNQ